MRIWQPRTTVWIGTGALPWRRRSLSARSGAAATATGSAPSTAKLSSGIGLASHGPGALLQPGEKACNLAPDRRAPGHAAPVRADQADQLVALVQRRQVVRALYVHAIDQERLDVRFHAAQDGI